MIHIKINCQVSHNCKVSTRLSRTSATSTLLNKSRSRMGLNFSSWGQTTITGTIYLCWCNLSLAGLVNNSSLLIEFYENFSFSLETFLGPPSGQPLVHIKMIAFWYYPSLSIYLFSSPSLNLCYNLCLYAFTSLVHSFFLLWSRKRIKWHSPTGIFVIP